MHRDNETTRTNIVLDTQLVDAGLRLTGIKTRRELVDLALRELVRHERQKRLLALKGRIDWNGDLDTMRTDLPADGPNPDADQNPA